MKNIFFAFAFLLVSSFSFASSNINKIDLKSDISLRNNLVGTCTVSTTRTINSGDGNSYTVTVTNTRNTCYEAWSANEEELNNFENGVKPAKKFTP